ncbi:SxtJ family membrane protein [Pontibacter pamirensis]|uniref:SxtJ family membrane protein n=1 Tax=Pontibacter pamirensis TaxID=2562824 RepID=UPI0013897702|nr:SxtJ family membrane protein [Pontibacter pamirensis]
MSSKKIKSDPVKTVLVITVGMLLVYIISEWEWALYVSLAVGALGLLSGYLAKKIDFLWMKLTWVLSYIMPNIILSIVFYIFLVPVAFLSRIFGEKNQLSLKNTDKSLFKEHKKKYDKVSFEKTW